MHSSDLRREIETKQQIIFNIVEFVLHVLFLLSVLYCA